MSALNNSLLLSPGASSSYTIPRSLRFNAPDSAFLSRTPSVAGNRKTWTWAGWVKRGKLSITSALFVATNGTGNVSRASLQFNTSDQMQMFSNPSGSSVTASFTTNAVFRDPSAWFHVLLYFDTTQATSTDRFRLYVNGVQQTFSAATYMAQNEDAVYNQTILHYIGNYQNSDYGDFCLADVHFCDGYAYDPSYFTTTDTNGIIQPKAFTGSYGTNGFRLPFSNNASTTTISQDSSGNNNHWTASNISVAAGAGSDSLVDSPTNGTASSGGDAGGVVVGNYCTWNPLDSLAGTLSNGNLDSTSSGSGIKRGTIGVSSGKWYWEVTITSAADRNIGIARLDSALTASTVGAVTGQVGYYCSQAFPPSPLAGTKYVNGSSSTYGAYYYSGDTIGIALDLDAGQVTFYVNGVSQGVAATGLTGTWTAAHSAGSGAGANMTANFGARPFAYAAPAGFRSLNTANLPQPTILKGSNYFDTKLYTGNGGSQTISGLGFSPDLVWIKCRSNVESHVWTDVIRGDGKLLFSNDTAAEATTSRTALGTNAFTVVDDASSLVNELNQTYAGWCWDGGTSSVTNTAGTITGGAQVRANASAGFSIVTYTGNGSDSQTIGHGLGAAPQFIIIKRRDTSGYGWIVGNSSSGWSKFLQLESTNALASTPALFGNTAPTSAVFTVSNASNGSTNASGGTYVAYCFAPVAGFSAFGSYTGNGSATDGPFVYTGFRPRWVLVKRTDAAGCHWTIWDTSRDSSNYAGRSLYANLSNAEDSNAPTGGLQVIDVLSNGFKLRDTGGTSGQVNGSGATYIYCAFAESPFSIARAR